MKVNWCFTSPETTNLGVWIATKGAAMREVYAGLVRVLELLTEGIEQGWIEIKKETTNV